MRNRVASVLLLSCALGLGACSSPVQEAEPSPRPSNPTLVKMEVLENNSELAEHVHLERVAQDPVAVPLTVQFDIVNQSKSPYDFLYRVRWFDANAMMVDGTEVWAPRTIGGRERLSLKAVAPTPNAVDYRLVIKEWQR